MANFSVLRTVPTVASSQKPGEQFPYGNTFQTNCSSSSAPCPMAPVAGSAGGTVYAREPSFTPSTPCNANPTVVGTIPGGTYAVANFGSCGRFSGTANVCSFIDPGLCPAPSGLQPVSVPGVKLGVEGGQPVNCANMPAIGLVPTVNQYLVQAIYDLPFGTSLQQDQYPIIGCDYNTDWFTNASDIDAFIAAFRNDPSNNSTIPGYNNFQQNFDILMTAVCTRPSTTGCPIDPYTGKPMPTCSNFVGTDEFGTGIPSRCRAWYNDALAQSSSPATCNNDVVASVNGAMINYCNDPSNNDLTECLCINRASNTTFGPIYQAAQSLTVPDACWWQPCKNSGLGTFLVPTSLTNPSCGIINCSGSCNIIIENFNNKYNGPVTFDITNTIACNLGGGGNNPSPTPNPPPPPPPDDTNWVLIIGIAIVAIIIIIVLLSLIFRSKSSKSTLTPDKTI